MQSMWGRAGRSHARMPSARDGHDVRHHDAARDATRRLPSACCGRMRVPRLPAELLAMSGSRRTARLTMKPPNAGARAEATVDIAAIRARAEAATKGPWVASVPNRDEICHVYRPQDADIAEECGLPDALFIAAAREDIPALCDELEATRAKLAAVVAAVQYLAPYLPTRHKATCAESIDRECGVCDCGYDEAKAVRATLDKAREAGGGK